MRSSLPSLADALEELHRLQRSLDRRLVGVYQSDPETYRLLVQYMTRAIQEDTPAAGAFVDTVVAESEAIFSAGAADGTVRAHLQSATCPRVVATTPTHMARSDRNGQPRDAQQQRQAARATRRAIAGQPTTGWRMIVFSFSGAVRPGSLR